MRGHLRRMKTVGLRIAPWGAPAPISAGADVQPSTAVIWRRDFSLHTRLMNFLVASCGFRCLSFLVFSSDDQIVLVFHRLHVQ